MNADADKARADEDRLERLHAVPVVDLSPVVAPPEAAGVEEERPLEAAAPAEADSPPLVPPLPPDDARNARQTQDERGWAVPFLAGALLGASAFYAALWLLALI